MSSRWPRGRLRLWMFLCALTMLAASAYSLGSCTAYVPHSWRPAATATTKPSHKQVHTAFDVTPLLRPRVKYIGVSPPGLPHTNAGLIRFASATGIRPNLVSYYIGWGTDFEPAVIQQIHSYGALPLINIDSDKVPVSAIAAGRYDAFLARYGRAVRRLNLPVAISFDHEFNGPWFAWGYKHTQPAVFVAAWRRMHDIFRAAGATNVIWVWMTGPAVPRTVPVHPFYPGDAYVDWIGTDGYYAHPDSTFTSVFGPIFAQVREFTSLPLLITETAVVPATFSAAKVKNLFDRIKARQDVVGFIWFDYRKRHDWRLEKDPAALAAYRKAAAGWYSGRA